MTKICHTLKRNVEWRMQNAWIYHTTSIVGRGGVVRVHEVVHGGGAVELDAGERQGAGDVTGTDGREWLFHGGRRNG